MNPIEHMLAEIEAFLKEQADASGEDLDHTLATLAQLRQDLPPLLQRVKGDIQTMESQIQALLDRADDLYKRAIGVLTGPIRNKTINDSHELAIAKAAEVKKVAAAICSSNAAKVVRGGLELYFDTVNQVKAKGSWDPLGQEGESTLKLMSSQANSELQTVNAAALFLQKQRDNFDALATFPGFSLDDEAQALAGAFQAILSGPIAAARQRATSTIAGILAGALANGNERLTEWKQSIQNQVRALQFLAALAGIVAGFVRLFA